MTQRVEDTLVERLQSPERRKEMGCKLYPLLPEAASRILSLESEVVRLREALEDATGIIADFDEYQANVLDLPRLRAILAKTADAV